MAKSVIRESDDTHDTTTKSDDKKADEYVSKQGDGGTHCHLWVDKEKNESGVVHRDACKVCDDAKDSSNKTGGDTWPPSNQSSGSGNPTRK
jgi:hypothetical protein